MHGKLKGTTFAVLIHNQNYLITMKYLLLFTMLAILSCGGSPKPEDFKVRVIDGCEYLEYDQSNSGNASTYSLTHKGNCSNPIHIYNVDTLQSPNFY